MNKNNIKDRLKKYKPYFPQKIQKAGARAWRGIEIPLGSMMEWRSIEKGHQIIWPVEEIGDFEKMRFLGPASHDVQVKTVFSLVSPGTERAQIQNIGGNNTYPFLPGYSGSGEVVKFGKKVNEFRKGDRVAGRIAHCSQGLVLDQFLFHIPNGVSFEQAAFIELGIIVLQGIHKAGIQPGETVLVLGQGLIGQLTNRLARLAGGTDILAVARSRAKENAAVSHGGADQYLVLDELKSLDSRKNFDLVIETTGQADIFPLAGSFLKKGGRIIGLGTPRGRGNINLGQSASGPGIKIIGAHITGLPAHERMDGLWTYQSEGRLFLDLLAGKKLYVDDLVTEVVDPARANIFYESLQTNDPEIIGVLFDWKTYRP